MVYSDVSVVSLVFCFFKQKTAYEMRISDWSSDVCSSDLWHSIDIVSLGCRRTGDERRRRGGGDEFRWGGIRGPFSVVNSPNMIGCHGGGSLGSDTEQ